MHNVLSVKYISSILIVLSGTVFSLTDINVRELRYWHANCASSSNSGSYVIQPLPTTPIGSKLTLFPQICPQMVLHFKRIQISVSLQETRETIRTAVPPFAVQHNPQVNEQMSDVEATARVRRCTASPPDFACVSLLWWDARISAHNVQWQSGDSAWGAGVPLGLPQKPLSSFSC